MPLTIKAVLRDAHAKANGISPNGPESAHALLSLAALMADQGIGDIAADSDQRTSGVDVKADHGGLTGSVTPWPSTVDDIAQILRGRKFTAAESDRLIDIILSRAVIATE